MQVRAKVKIEKGSLQLWPHGGKICVGSQPTPAASGITLEGIRQRGRPVGTEYQKKAEKLHCSIMKGVKLTAQLDKKYVGAAGETYDVTSFSPLSYQDLVERDSPIAPYRGKPVAPFWGVPLASRKSKSLVNMTACSQHIKVQEPKFQDEGSSSRLPGWLLSLKLVAPYLTNTVDIEEGGLLVLPFDGGADSIVL